jgi:hypothetical protein
VIPPQAEIAVLHDLALQGNMRGLAQRADYLAALDASYAPFARQVRDLAAGFQSKAALRLTASLQQEGDQHGP